MYQSPGNADAWCDATLASDNSLIRCYLSRGDSTHAFQQTCYVQRITDPGNASQWSTWTALPSSSAVMWQDGGICVSNNPGTPNVLRIFAQQGTTNNNILNWSSTDNGVTWTGPGIVVAPPGGALTKGITSAGNNDCFFMYDVVGGDSMGAVFFTGSWSSINTWPFSPFASAAGCAAVYIPTLGYYIVHTDGFGLYNVNFNPTGSVWNGLGDKPVSPATSTAIIRTSPRIHTFENLFWLTCIETDSGLLTQSVYSYPRVRKSADMVHWSNGFILHNLQPTSYGCNYFRWTAPPAGLAGARYYAVTMPKVLSDTIYGPSAPTRFVDLSGAVLQYVRSEQPAKPGKLDVIVDNAQGQYNGLVSIGAGGPYEPIGKNTTLVLSEGYQAGSPTAPNVIQVGKYHVNDITFVRTPQENSIHIVAYDLTKNLDLESRYQITWSSQTLGWLVTEVAARGGIFSVSLPGTSQVGQIVISYTLHAGNTYRQALNELCATYGLVYFLDQNETLQFRELQASDNAVWSYQPEIELVQFGTTEVRANHVIVSGKPPTGGASGALTISESYDDINAQDTGVERLLHYSDVKLTTVAECASKAAFIMAQEQRSQVKHQVTVPANPALQLMDVVNLVDSAAPVGSGQAGPARIDALNVHFDALRVMFDLHMLLEGV